MLSNITPTSFSHFPILTLINGYILVTSNIVFGFLLLFFLLFRTYYHNLALQGILVRIIFFKPSLNILNITPKNFVRYISHGEFQHPSEAIRAHLNYRL